ncbi:MAG TPA: UDP-N-acetylglucosamine--N-acetylmuramyl-(pentapeptide) pyrophosphoryl-undecaprenol N-acetylglucosamine transferase [Opitutaceae bacterium]|nr:UDP-N-acetylglucosamine--N-acetylmuramyl-(pentapeptide) pyrophosphoryl-undecaprenol N-acetylglucosamine transferase [Opitutaceae bacterium]
MSRFIISCGGTGGHLSPGISLAEGLTARGHEAVLLISQKKVDARLSEKYPQLRFERMPGTAFSWHPIKLLRCIVTQVAAILFCLRLLRRMQADGAVGFGGFTSAPVVIAGWLTGTPVALHESNRVPGLAIRTLGRLVQRVYLPPGIWIRGIRAAVTRHVGLPVRREIVRVPQAAARAALGLDANHRLLVVLGGSQGASSLNDWARQHLESCAAEGIQIYCVTGLGKGRDETIELKTKTGAPLRSVFTAFSDRMAELMSAADLVVSRAGAGTLAELIRCETPAILVPYPHAADDHQRANAGYFERQGGGFVVAQTQVAQLHAEVLDTIFNDWLIRKFRANLQRMDRANPLEIMLDDLQQIAGGESGPLPRLTPAGTERAGFAALSPIM